MKLIHAIVSSDDGGMVTQVLTDNHYSVTRLATTGGFLKKGNTTVLIGTDDEKVDDVITLIKETCGARQKIKCDVPTLGAGAAAAGYMTVPTIVEVGGATIFVIDIERFEKI